MFGELVTWYLFFGGLAGGSCLVCLGVRWYIDVASSSGEEEKNHSELVLWQWVRLHRRTYKAMLIIVLLAAIMGCICLLGDLTRPQQAHLLFIQPTLSVLNLGAIVLVTFIICVTALLLFVLMPVHVGRKASRVTEIFAGALAIIVVVYTGIYLNGMWTVAPWSSPFLIALFLFSSLSTGAAALLVVVGLSGFSCLSVAKPIECLLRADVVCIVCEGVALGAMWLQLGGLDELTLFKQLFIDGAPLQFWVGFVTCGLLVPLVMEVAFTCRKQTGNWFLTVLGVLILVGGFFLRFCVMNAAVEYKALMLMVA
ncbi:NrfD/PsrC family molybdoenzyme membrane anchor subunit [Adlercreutzia sp. ZJ141]|uniref:NrfD/PsrC family molybdoenzyme membrane anchor subunit n=1 Tax=Adlercreutzia sp. ZJ141 TaxID=2709406 RepID=UPI0013ED67F5|nr:NrfD/PsrC family molybdoenzyme membrane anchor subunit [Adlercreutzia sp. ZJ141]